jgi:hypothetical protein
MNQKSQIEQSKIRLQKLSTELDNSREQLRNMQMSQKQQLEQLTSQQKLNLQNLQNELQAQFERTSKNSDWVKIGGIYWSVNSIQNFANNPENSTLEMVNMTDITLEDSDDLWTAAELLKILSERQSEESEKNLNPQNDSTEKNSGSLFSRISKKQKKGII